MVPNITVEPLYMAPGHLCLCKGLTTFPSFSPPSCYSFSGCFLLLVHAACTNCFAGGSVISHKLSASYITQRGANCLCKANLAPLRCAGTRLPDLSLGEDCPLSKSTTAATWRESVTTLNAMTWIPLKFPPRPSRFLRPARPVREEDRTRAAGQEPCTLARPSCTGHRICIRSR